MPPLLDISHLRVDMPTTSTAPPVSLLDDVSLSLDRGQSLGLVGESGCGKSLTALATIGLLPPGLRAHGRLVLDGEDLLTASEKRLCQIRGRRVAMVFQEPMTALNPVRTIGAQVAEGPRHHLGLTRRQAREHARAILTRVGLDPHLIPPGMYPHQLSGGQRQRVVIAMAIACDPALLIADEPTTALDVASQARILDLIRDLVAERSMALLMISHDLGVIAETAPALAVMYAGRVVETGPTARVLRAPRHPYTHGLLRAMPHRHAPPGALLPAIPGTVPSPGSLPPGCAFADRCNRADEICRAQRPLLINDGRQDHAAACHHPFADPLAAGGSDTP